MSRRNGRNSRNKLRSDLLCAQLCGSVQGIIISAISAISAGPLLLNHNFFISVDVHALLRGLLVELAAVEAIPRASLIRVISEIRCLYLRGFIVKHHLQSGGCAAADEQVRLAGGHVLGGVLVESEDVVHLTHDVECARAKRRFQCAHVHAVQVVADGVLGGGGAGRHADLVVAAYQDNGGLLGNHLTQLVQGQLRVRVVILSGVCPGILPIVNLVAGVAAVERRPVVAVVRVCREGKILYVGIERLAVDGTCIAVVDVRAVGQLLAALDADVVVAVAAGVDVVGGITPAEGDGAALDVDSVVGATGADVAAIDGKVTIFCADAILADTGCDVAPVDGDVIVGVEAIASIGGAGNVEFPGAEGLAADGEVVCDDCANIFIVDGILRDGHCRAVGEDEVTIAGEVDGAGVADVAFDDVPADGDTLNCMAYSFMTFSSCFSIHVLKVASSSK